MQPEHDDTARGPFGRAAQTYRAAGWSGVLPLGAAPGKKYPPPGGWTGHGAPYPSAPDVAAWMETHDDRNIGLRMPPGVIGLDVDAGYGDKRGDVTLAELEARFGPLPPTWVSSARSAPSGIRLFRVPTHLDGREINWPGEAGKFIEIIQPGHRYAVVWPSTNPDAGGAQYRWSWQFEYEGDWPDEMLVPRPDRLTPLPEAWVRGLALPYDRTEKAALGNLQLADWWSRLRPGPPCPLIHSVWTKAVDELRRPDSGARHETARDALSSVVRAGGEGHRGATEAVAALHSAFSTAVGPDRAASGEWERMLEGAVKLAASTHPEPLQACSHDAPPPATGLTAPRGFAEAAQRQRHEATVAAAEVFHARADEMAQEVDRLPFDERAEAVRRLIPEISTWPEVEQSYARDSLSSKHGTSGLGVTEFRQLLRAEVKARKEATEAAAHEAARHRAAEQVQRARDEGTLLPPPHAPIDVARALAERMTVPARWWRGDYYRWTGTRYVPWRDEAVDNWLYGQTADAWFEAGEEEGTKPWRPTETKITSVSHALSRGVLYRPSEDEPEDPAEEIACANGVLHVPTGELREHSPARFNLQSVPFAYDAAATATTWEWFLGDVLPADARAFLQEWFGYVLSGRTDLEKIANLVGLPRSGKGTIATVLEALIGGESVASPSMPSLVGTFGEQPLIGKTLAVFSDISWSHRDVVTGVEILKAISGQDTRDVNRKNREIWHGRLGVRFMIMGNDMPRFTDASGALAGRMIHVQFPGSVAGRERPTLKTELLAELPGILNWALEGLRRLTANGRFTVPQTSEELAAEVRRQMSPVQGFLDDCTARGDANTPPAALDDVFAAYQGWAKAAEVDRPLDRERFSRALGSAGVHVERRMINGVRARRVHGIAPLAPGWFFLYPRPGSPLPPTGLTFPEVPHGKKHPNT